MGSVPYTAMAEENDRGIYRALRHADNTFGSALARSLPYGIEGSF